MTSRALSPSFLYCLQNWTSLGEVEMLWKRVFESVAAAALPGKRIAVATTDNEPA